MGYGGAVFAFVVSLIGALEVAGQTLVSIEESLDVWLGGYDEGTYAEILKDVEQSDSMQTFLSTFTWDIIVYSLASFWHAFFVSMVGFIVAFYLFFKMSTLNGTYQDMINGFTYMLYGVLIGTVNYMGGNALKGTMDSVLKSMGFLEHSRTDTSQSESITLTQSVGGVAATTTISADEVDYTLDYEKLLYMQDNWFNFFFIQRSTQMLAPYLFMLAIEAATAGIFIMGFIFIK